MDNKAPVKTFIPQVDGRALDFIKICAAVFMVIDHINLMWFDSEIPGMFLIGRATFPLFCYALAVAFVKTGPEKSPRYGLTRYAPRLLAVALLTEPISMFTRDMDGVLNVLFTLALGAALAGISFRLKDWQLIGICILAMAMMAFQPVIEFDSVGVVLPMAFVMAMTGRRAGTPCLIALLCFVNMGGFGDSLNKLSPDTIGFMGIIAASCIFLPWWVGKFAQRVPQDGRYLHKYALHIFYPLHLVILWAVAHFILGVA